MTITCPQCGFSRAVAENRLGGKSVVAVCPKCGCRFRFSAKDGVGEVLPPKGRQTLDEPLGQSDARAAEDGESAVFEKWLNSRKADESGRPEKTGWADESGKSEESEEDIRQLAAEAYRREAGRFENEEDRINPWDAAPGKRGWIWAFWQVVLRVMFGASNFFASLNPAIRQTRSLFFFLIVCIAQILVEKFWSGILRDALLGSAETDPQLQKLLELMASREDILLTLLLRTGMLVLQLYIFSFLMYLVYRIVARDRATYSLIFQIMAYSAAPALLCVVPGIGSIAGMIWSLACLAIGCRTALRLSWAQTFLGFLPVVFVLTPLLFQTLALLQSAI